MERNMQYRELTQEEMGFVVGGLAAATNLTGVTVNGSSGDYYYWNVYMDPYLSSGGGGGYDLRTTTYGDLLANDVGGGGGSANLIINDGSHSYDYLTVNANTLHRALTPTENTALGDLDAAIALLKDDLSHANQNAALTMSDGQVIKISDFINALNRVTWVINEVGTQYANGTTSGQSDYISGFDSININTVTGYDDMSGGGGANFLAIHETAHFLAASQAYYNSVYQPGEGVSAANEQYVNDITRALGAYLNMAVLSSGDASQIIGGYSSTQYHFTDPSSGGGSGGGLPGGGGGSKTNPGMN